ncbi:hypothetical protein IJJ27_00595 [bacterium]|nr:hypothetical protein [bacterium]
MSTIYTADSYDVRKLLFSTICWAIVFLVSVFCIRTIFTAQWRQLYTTLYPEFATSVSSSTPTQETSLAVLPPPAPPATASAVFIDNLIQAILEASSPAEASSEAAEMLSQL